MPVQLMVHPDVIAHMRNQVGTGLMPRVGHNQIYLNRRDFPTRKGFRAWMLENNPGPLVGEKKWTNEVITVDEMFQRYGNRIIISIGNGWMEVLIKDADGTIRRG